MQTIGQLAKQMGVRTSTLRYYEKEGLITPDGRSASGFLSARLFLALEQEDSAKNIF